MNRITKDPEDRKQEIIDTAEKLFAQKGFEKTLVSDIVKEIGIAQGTYYYYFKSKEEIMVAILDKRWEEAAKDLQNETKGSQTSAKEKLEQFFLKLLMPDLSGANRMKYRMFMDPEILRTFHTQLDEARSRHLKPVIEKIIFEGMDSGLFKELKNTSEVVDIVFYGINMYLHHAFSSFKDAEVLLKKIAGIEELLERVLGMEQGSIRIREGLMKTRQ